MEDTSFFADGGNEPTQIQSGESSNGPSTLSSKFDQEMWLAIEQKMSTYELDVLKVLVEYACGVDASTSKIFKSISDEFYRQHRSSLVLQMKRNKTSAPIPLKLVIGDMQPIVEAVQQVDPKGKKVKKEKVKPLTSIEKLRQQNSINRIGGVITDILQTFNASFVNITDVSLNSAMANDIVEVKGIALLYACAWVDYHREVFNVESQYETLFDIIATTQKFINICRNPAMMCQSLISGECRPSETMIIDLENWVARLRTRFVKNGQCVFNWENIQHFAPSIFTQSKYSKLLPQHQVKLKQHQKDIIDAVRVCIETGLWGIYDAMIGSGKTTGQIGIAALVAHLRTSNPLRYGKLRMLSVCNSEAVRFDVAQKLYNIATTYPEKKLHFAVANSEYDRQLRRTKAKIVKNNACPRVEDVVTIVASPQVAKLLLEANDELSEGDPERYEYILFNDEPNMGADNIESKPLRDNVALNHVTPYITINSSATFPTVDMLSTITANFFSRHPGARQVRVYSNEISIGCDIRTFSGEIVVPHLGARTVEQLREIINGVKGCAFLGKAYTPAVVNSLYNRMLHYHVDDFATLPNVPLLFTDVANLSINRVRETAMELLDILVTRPNDVIQMVCATNIAEDDDEEEDEPVKTGGFSFSSNSTQDDVPTSPLDYSKLGTTQAYRLQGQTLIATRNPEQFVLDNFSELIDRVYASETRKVVKGGDVATYLYRSTGDATRRYMTEVDEWEKKSVTIERNATSPDDLRAKQDEHEANKPKFPFPEWAHVGSTAHTNEFARSHKDKLVGTLTRSHLNVPHLTSDSKKIINVDDRILTALYCGVAIYSTETVRCRVYLDIVLQLASVGALAFVVADSSICFGTNYPFYNVIITQEFSEIHGMLVLFQVMGRAGRPGKSPKALIIVPDTVARRIINYLTSSTEANVEASNMETMFQRQVEAISVANDERIERQINEIARQSGLNTNTGVSSLTVIRSSNAPTNPVQIVEPVVSAVQPTIVPISEVPDGKLKFNPQERDTRQKIVPPKNGDWRNTRTRDSSSSASEWKRGVSTNDVRPQSSAGGGRQDRPQSSAGGSKYIPPNMRQSQTQSQSDERVPRYKQPDNRGNSKPSSSTGWKKDSAK